MRLTGVICVLSVCVLSTVNAQFSDNFEEPSMMQHWQIFHSGDTDYYESLMCNDELIEGAMLTNTDGRLVMTCGHTYWYANVTGPYIYQLTWGDFTATTSVQALNRYNTALPPDHEFNSAGLVVRNPDDTWGQNYIMTNLGMQSAANQIGSESKTTFNSNSTLYLDPDLHYGEVRIERVGTLIRTYKRTGSDTDFVLLDEFNRPDIPDTVQIGMVLNGYNTPPDIRGEFEHIHFTGGDCRIVRHGENEGVSSLRQAINCAAAGDTIWFDDALIDGPIEITDTPLQIDKDLVIYNSNPVKVLIHGNTLSRMLEILPGAQVTMHGIHFTGDSNVDEHLILNSGTLSLVNCEFTGDAAMISAVENQGTLFIDGVCTVR